MHNLKKRLFCLILVFIGFFGLYEDAYALEITDIRFGDHGNALRIVMDLDQEADFSARMQDGPVRLTVDMPVLSGKPLIGRASLPDALKDIRLEPLGTLHSRLEFMLAGPAAIRSAFLMPREGDKPARLVVDLAPASQAVFEKNAKNSYGTLKTGSDTAAMQIDKPSLPFAAGKTGVKLAPVTGPKIPAPKIPVVATPPSPVPPEDPPLVIIDAGHGGRDYGAVGHGATEKDITLAVAMDLKKSLEKTGRFRVALTRERDIFIPLADRVRMARAANADLFVSVHADSFAGSEAARGASFYTLSARASDAQSAALAARENRADEVGGVALPTDDRDLREILIDLAMRETTHQSKLSARNMAKAFKTAGIKTLPSPERAAGFVVLKAPDVPSILIELGFISNTVEAAQLNDSAYRTRLADTLTKGIEAYFSVRKSK